MRKLLLSFFALIAAASMSAQSSASNDKVSVSNISLSVAEGEKIDEDGDFKVVLNYAVSIVDAAISEHSYMVVPYAEYVVTDADNNVVDSYKYSLSLSANNKNMYISGLESGKEYTLNISKFFVVDKSNADYETNYGDTIIVMENCAQVKFTPAAGEVKPIDIKSMSVTYNKNELIDEDGDYKVTFNYTGIINDANIKPENLFSVVKYQVYDTDYNYIDGGDRDFDLANETSRNIYISKLQPGKQYQIMITGLVVMNGNTEVLNLTSGLPKLTFKVKDPNAPQAISMSGMSLTVAEGEKIDSDGDFKVTFNYTTAINDASAINWPYAVVSYKVTDEKDKEVATGLKDFDFSASSKSLYISDLKDGATYTITVTKIEIQDLMTMEMLCEMDANLPSLTFTVGANASGINNATITTAKAGKFLVNGKLVIVKAGKKYNTNAVEVK